jgi:biopolymer transport protein ExbD
MRRASVALSLLAVLAFPVAAITQQPVQEQSTNSATHNKNGQNKKSNPPVISAPEPKKDVPLQPPAPEKTNESIHIENSKTDWWARISNVLIAFGTLALAIIGAIAACIAIRSLRVIGHQATHAKTAALAAKRSADAYEKTVRLTERADVLLDAISIVQPEGNPYFQDGRVIVTFKNFGRTRANNLKSSVTLTVPDVEPLSVEAPLDTVLGPGDTQKVTFGTLAEWLTREKFEGVYQRKIELRFDAKVSYADIFEVTHMMECGGVYVRPNNFFRVDYNRAN